MANNIWEADPSPYHTTAEHRRGEVMRYLSEVTKCRRGLSDAVSSCGTSTIRRVTEEDALTYTYFVPSRGRVDCTIELENGATVRARVAFRVYFCLSGRMILTDTFERARDFKAVELVPLYRAIDELLEEEEQTALYS